MSSSVKLLKNRFEKLNSEVVESLDITPLRAKRDPPSKFSRSATCIDFSKFQLKEVAKEPEAPKEDPAKFQFQRQLSNSSSSSYKSIRRSPAFRFDAQNRPSVAKNALKEDPAKRKIEFDELEYLSTSATIKKALLKPLPTGSPPKKPPRIFHSPQLDRNRAREASPDLVRSRFQQLKISPNTLPKKADKSEEKRALSSFFNCIISPCTIDPIYYEQIRKERNGNREAEETIYMEPYAHLALPDVKAPAEELHYMCTVLDPQPTDPNGNVDAKRRSLDAADIEDYEKVNVKAIKKNFYV